MEVCECIYGPDSYVEDHCADEDDPREDIPAHGARLIGVVADLLFLFIDLLLDWFIDLFISVLEGLIRLGVNGAYQVRIYFVLGLEVFSFVACVHGEIN